MSDIASALRELALTPEEIAARSKLPAARINELLQGSAPTYAELRALSLGLRRPIRSFVSEKSPRSEQDSRVLFRAVERDKGAGFETTFNAVMDFVTAALQILPPSKGVPIWLHQFEVKEETYSEASRLAVMFREIFTPESPDEPFLNLPWLLAAKTECVISQLTYSRYEGASLVAQGYGFVFVSPRFSGRMLFTLAHEVGHLIAHHHDGSSAVFERPSQIFSKTSRSRHEAFVDAFASMLLLPDRGVARALNAIRGALNIRSDNVGDVEILILSRMFGVSFEVAARRCEDLDLIPGGGAYSLARQLKKDYGSPERRADELRLPARPSIDIPRISSNLLEVIKDRIESGEISVGWASDNFGISISELYASRSSSHGGSHESRR